MVRPSSAKSIPRHELIAAALDLGILRPESLTESELMTEIQRVSEGKSEAAAPLPTSRGWLGVARHLMTSVVEQGLNLPSAARVIRDSVRPRSVPSERPPLPTVTLAQIYISQGHDERAVATLRDVLRRDPVHPKAQRLLDEMLGKADPASDRARSAAVPADVPEAQDHGSQLPTDSVGADASGELGDVSANRKARTNDAKEVEAGEVEQASEQLPPEEDTLLVFRRDDEAILYWELGRRGQAARRRGARLELRVVTFTPDPRGALAEDQCHPIGDVRGCFHVQCDANVVARAALGIQEEGRWHVLRVASALVVVPEQSDLQEDFSPRKGALDPAVIERARVAALGERGSAPPN